MTGLQDAKITYFGISGTQADRKAASRSVKQLLQGAWASARKGLSVERGPEYYKSPMFRSSRWF